MIAAIVFDIGGVLVRNENPSLRRNLEKKYKLPPYRVDELVFDSQAAHDSTIGLVEPQKIWQNIAKKLDLNQVELQKFMDDFWACDQLDQELIAFLRNCRPQYKTSLLTNAWKGARQTFAELYELSEQETVDYMIISSEQGVAKPDQEIYEILRKKLACEYQQILFVDDFIENIEAAAILGIHTVHFQPGMDLINTIKLILKK